MTKLHFIELFSKISKIGFYVSEGDKFWNKPKQDSQYKLG